MSSSGAGHDRRMCLPVDSRTGRPIGIRLKQLPATQACVSAPWILRSADVERDGCLPEDEIGDDLILDIRRKFACIYSSAIERAENQLKASGLRLHDDFSFCLVIDPCYENSTHVAVVDLWPDVRPFCYFHEYAKAWHFFFTSLKDIAQEVLRAEKIILITFLHLRKQRPLKGGNNNAGISHHLGD